MHIKQENNVITVTLLLAAAVSCMLFSGGLSWQFCIVPNILLFAAVIVNYKKVIFDYTSLLLFTIMLFGILPLTFTCGDKQYAIHEYEKIICLILAYYAGSATDTKDIVKVISISGVILAVFGLLGYCNLIRINEFVFNDRKLLRLQSFVKYANTAAAILGCGYLAVIGRYGETKKQYLLYIGGSVLTAFFLTISKASIFILAVIVTVLIIADKDLSGRLIYQTIICFATAISTAAAVKNHFNSAGLLIITAGVVVSAIKGIKIFEKRIIAKLWIVAFLTGVLSVLAFVLISKADIFNTLSQRFTYMRDALKLLKEHWLFGIGSGGWKYYQYSVQSKGYNIAYVHNGWLQFWLENGIIAFAALTALLIISIYDLAKRKAYILLSILLMIAVHSFFDTDMSFGAVLIILGFIMGNGAGRRISENKLWSISVIAQLCLSFLIITYMSGEFYVRNRFEKSYLDKQYGKALEYAQQLEKICPYDGNLQVSIAALNNTEAQSRLERAVKISPLDKDIYKAYVDYQLDTDPDVKIIELTEKYMNLAPKQETTYADIQVILKNALEKELLTEEEYEKAVSETERRRKQAYVINRNDLLHKLTN